MRIERLYLKNFAPPFLALDKSEISLDYRSVKSKVINIFIGQMGSCKTFLLSHHQPYATLGTLDVRNSEDMVLPGKRGIKEIDYTKGKDLYEIRHVYVPTKDSHSVKSYIKKNGVELNENGNSSSFKLIIETEFGLDQNFLKLFRIGSNVTNLPDMGPTERKSFVGSMLSENDLYLFLYKKIGEDNRSLNAQISMLINRIHAISTRDPVQLKSDLDLEMELAGKVEKQSQATNQELYRMEAVIDNLLKGKSVERFEEELKFLREQHVKTQEELAAIQEELDSMREHPSESDISSEMSGLNGRMEIRTKNIMSLSNEIETDDRTQASIRDKLAVLGSTEHIDTLRTTYNQLMSTIKDYERQLARFTYTGSLTSIMGLISEIATFDGLVSMVAQYNIDAIREIYRNKGKALNSAQRQITQLHRSRDLAQREMSNLNQVAMYESTHVMMRPFNCPTKECPYYQYHPDTEKKKRSGQEIDSAYMKHRNLVNQIDAKISYFEDFPAIASRLDTLRGAWKRIQPIAEELGILLVDDLSEIITNPTKHQWYDAAKLQHTKELCGIREKYYDLMDRVASMRNQLNVYEVSDVDTLERELAEVDKRLTVSTKKLEEMEADNEKDANALKRLQELAIKIGRIAEMERQAKSLAERASDLRVTIDQMSQDSELISHYTTRSSELRAVLAEQKTAYRVHLDEINKIQRKLNDIQYTTEQYKEAKEKQELLKDVLDAVSSKKGIPLAFIRLFLADCKGVINDLIADVFADKIEVQTFDIPASGAEFNIPYTRNGTLINDITRASQGEAAVISIALSFALIRQGNFPYNIMLLDEVDAPLYKEDRQKFIAILLRQLHAIQAEQVFIISHNNTFEGFNVNVIMTTNEVVDENPLMSIMHV